MNNKIKSNTLKMVLDDGRDVEVVIEIDNNRTPRIAILSNTGEDISDEIGDSEFVRILGIVFDVIEDSDLV